MTTMQRLNEYMAALDFRQRVAKHCVTAFGASILLMALGHCAYVRTLDDLGDQKEMRADRERTQTEFYFPNPCPPSK